MKCVHFLAGNSTQAVNIHHSKTAICYARPRIFHPGGCKLANIEGDDGNNTITGGSGSDTISGKGGNDSLDGGFGDDTIYGGDGDDTITGGGGHDSIVGGRGNDTMSAGNSSTTDTFVIRDGDGSDTILDFDPGEPDVIAFNMAEIQTFQDFQDRLSMDGGDTVITYDNGETTRLIGVNMDNLSAQNFSTEAGPVCLHADTLIQTPDGWTSVQSLTEGDLVTTDGKVAEVIEAVCVQRLHFTNRFDQGKPILIAKDSLGKGYPFRDCIVSPQHRIALPKTSGEVNFIAAVKLCERPGIRRMLGRKMAIYHNILLSRHAIIFANGLPVETALLTDFTRKAFQKKADHLSNMKPLHPIIKVDKGARLGT